MSHERAPGTAYLDLLLNALSDRGTSTGALAGTSSSVQQHDAPHDALARALGMLNGAQLTGEAPLAS
jgi:hypothetical protein